MPDEKATQKPAIVEREDFLKNPGAAMRLADTRSSVGIRDPDGVVRSYIVSQRDPVE